jgi:SAM-dependent methyltransferase
MRTPPTIADWHAQFARQASWTQAMRSQLYRRAGLLQAEQVLDVGSGTGGITEELAQGTRGTVTGLDIDPERVAFARQQAGRARYEQGDALSLPYPAQRFDIVCCHFLLMWVSDPARAVREMARVLRRDGTVLICAEPDYGGRVDWPDLPIRQWQIDGLRRQGADPLMGRRLRQLLAQAGLGAEIGLFPARWSIETGVEDSEAEWFWVRYDVGEAVDAATLDQAQNRAKVAIAEGTRLVFVPTFYAVGKLTWGENRCPPVAQSPR